MSVSEWKRIAEQYTRVSDARIPRVFPEVVRILLASGATRVLDYGCGDGRFDGMALQAGVPNMVLYDPVEDMRSKAEKVVAQWNGQAAVVAKRNELEEGSFDAVVWNAVWMCLPSRQECLDGLELAHRSLRSGGRFIASVTHPCFRDRQFATFRTSFDMDDYQREGHPFQVTMFDGDNVVQFTDYHWSLGEMTRQLSAAKFQIDEVREISDLDQAPWPRGVPWLILTAIKGK